MPSRSLSSPIRSSILLCTALVGAAGCGGDAVSPDAFAADAVATDPVTKDSATKDAATTDAPTRDAGTLGGGALDWSPGHYLLLRTGDATERDAALADATVQRTYRGLHVKYVWSQLEGATAGDYAAGFARLDADLAAVNARGMKLVIQLQTKTFHGDGDAVPSYLMAPGSSYCVGAQPSVCGQYTMGNGLTALLWQPPVRQRFEALIAAIGARYAPDGPRPRVGAAIAALVLPETANEEGPVSYEHVGYTQQGVVDAAKSILGAARRALPSRIAFQYINFLPPNGSAETYLRQIADFALATPGVGLGCPDLSPRLADARIPGYRILLDPAYANVPKNPSVQSPDLDADRTTGVRETMDTGRSAAPAGMHAGYITWYNGTGTAITPAQIAAEIARRGPITDPLPTWR